MYRRIKDNIENNILSWHQDSINIQEAYIIYNLGASILFENSIDDKQGFKITISDKRAEEIRKYMSEIETDIKNRLELKESFKDKLHLDENPKTWLFVNTFNGHESENPTVTEILLNSEITEKDLEDVDIITSNRFSGGSYTAIFDFIGNEYKIIKTMKVKKPRELAKKHNYNIYVLISGNY